MVALNADEALKEKLAAASPLVGRMKSLPNAELYDISPLIADAAMSYVERVTNGGTSTESWLAENDAPAGDREATGILRREIAAGTAKEFSGMIERYIEGAERQQGAVPAGAGDGANRAALLAGAAIPSAAKRWMIGSESKTPESWGGRAWVSLNAMDDLAKGYTFNSPPEFTPSEMRILEMFASTRHHTSFQGGDPALRNVMLEPMYAPGFFERPLAQWVHKFSGNEDALGKINHGFRKMYGFKTRSERDFRGYDELAVEHTPEYSEMRKAEDAMKQAWKREARKLKEQEDAIPSMTRYMKEAEARGADLEEARKEAKALYKKRMDIHYHRLGIAARYEGPEADAYNEAKAKVDAIRAGLAATFEERFAKFQQERFAEGKRMIEEVSKANGIPSYWDFAAEAKRQYDDVVARYTNPDGTKKPGWMLAPNGNPTNLTEREWVLVRTPNFKDWFGDWEVIANATLPQSAKTYADARYILNGLLNENLRSSDGLVATISGNSKEKMLSGKAVEKSVSVLAHLHAVANIKELFSRSVELDSADGNIPEVKTIHRLYAPFVFGDNVLVAKVSVKEFARRADNRLYTIEAMKIETPEGILAPTRSETETGRPHQGSLAERIARITAPVKTKNVSKIVDSNGEPLVVYHATDADIRVFDREKLGAATEANGGNVDLARVGFWFNESDLSDKLITSKEKTVRAFLNIRHPHFTSFDAMYDGERKKGADGYVVDDTELGGVSYVALKDSQIKSADENAGTFNPQNPDIRWMIAGAVGASEYFLGDKGGEGAAILDGLAKARRALAVALDAPKAEVRKAWEALPRDKKLAVKKATGWEVGADGSWVLEFENPKLSVGGKSVMRKMHGGNPASSTLGEIFGGDSALFRLYPALGSIRVANKKLGEGIVAQVAFSSRSGEPRIEINKTLRDNEDIPSAMLHEIQHVIQYYEGMANGGDAYAIREMLTNKVFEQFGAITQASGDVLAALKSALPESRIDPIISKVAKRFRKASAEQIQWEQVHAIYKELRKSGTDADNAICDSVKSLFSKVLMLLENIDRNAGARFRDQDTGVVYTARERGIPGIAYEVYHHLIGEVQARNTEMRYLMESGGLNLKNILLEDSEDIKRGEQLSRDDAEATILPPPTSAGNNNAERRFRIAAATPANPIAGNSSRAKLVALAASDIISGRRREAADYDRLAKALRADITGEQAIAEAREELKKPYAEAAAKLNRSGSQREALNALADGYDEEHLPEAVAQSIAGGLKTGDLVGTKGEQGIRKAIVMEWLHSRGLTGREMREITGIDILETMRKMPFEAVKTDEEAARETMRQTDTDIPENPEERTAEQQAELDRRQAGLDALVSRLEAHLAEWRAQSEARRREIEARHAKELEARRERGAELSAEDEDAEAEALEQEGEGAVAEEFAISIDDLKLHGIEIRTPRELFEVVKFAFAEHLVRTGKATDARAAFADKGNLVEFAKSMRSFLNMAIARSIDIKRFPRQYVNAKTAAEDLVSAIETLTMQRLMRRSVSVLAMARRGMEASDSAKAIRDIKKSIRQYAGTAESRGVDKMALDVKRRIQGAVEAQANYIAKAITMTEGELAKEKAKYEDVIDGTGKLYGEKDRDGLPPVEDDIAYGEAQTRLDIINKYGGLKSRSLLEIRNAEVEIGQWLSAEYKSHLERLTRRDFASYSFAASRTPFDMTEARRLASSYAYEKSPFVSMLPSMSYDGSRQSLAEKIPVYWFRLFASQRR